MDTLLAWLTAAVLTVAIETAILAVAGYRARRFILVCALVNAATNLTLNLGLSYAGGAYWAVLWPAEGAVVLVEWAVLRLVADSGGPLAWRSRPSARLFGCVVLANAVSLAVGLLLWIRAG